MEEEIWKPVFDYEQLYIVSNKGNVRRVFNKQLNSTINVNLKFRRKYKDKTRAGNYYLILKLSKGGIRKPICVHQLVAKAFIPNPKNKPQINHIDCHGWNNCVENLEWCTPKENVRHAVRNNLLRPVFGERNSNSKINNEIALEIFNMEGTYVEIAAKYNLYPATVSSIKSGNTWSRATGKQYKKRRASNRKPGIDDKRFKKNKIEPLLQGKKPYTY